LNEISGKGLKKEKEEQDRFSYEAADQMVSSINTM
jgi:hypothetical protein